MSDLPTFAACAEARLEAAGPREKTISIKISIPTARMMIEAERALNAELVAAACAAENRLKAYPQCSCHVGKAKAEFTKYGPKHDYRFAHCAAALNGRTLLGTIRDVYRDETRGVVHARVIHFNGEPWPFDPALSSLDILERD